MTPTDRSSSQSLIKSIAWYLVLSALVFVGAWFWLTWQLRFLLEQRVSETGHQLAEVAAIASAEAVVSEDKIYLEQLLQQLIEKDFVLQAAIYRLDGTLIIQQSPASGTQQPIEPNDESKFKHMLTAHLPQYLSPAVPFMVEVRWQNSAVGWLQITLDRLQLEQDFRSSSYQITLFSLSAFALSSLLGAIVLWRRTLKKKKPKSVENEPPQTTEHKPLHSLNDAAKRVKQKDLSDDQLHFKPVSLRRFTPHNAPTYQHTGLVQLFSLKPAAKNYDDTENYLSQQLMWQNLLFDAAALMDLKASLIGRNQFLVIGSESQTDDAIKLGALIHYIQQELSHQPELNCHCHMLLGHCSVMIKPLNDHLSLAAGIEFQDWLIKLRNLTSYGFLDEKLAAKIELVEHNSELQSLPLVVENHPDKTVGLPSEISAIIERQAQSLIKKYGNNANSHN